MPLKIHKDKERCGVKNEVGYTIMDCKCDDAFAACMKQVKYYIKLIIQNERVIRTKLRNIKLQLSLLEVTVNDQFSFRGSYKLHFHMHTFFAKKQLRCDTTV